MMSRASNRARLFRKKAIIIFLIILAVVGVAVLSIVKINSVKPKYSFDDVLYQYFFTLNHYDYNADNCKIHSVEAYAIPDDKTTWRTHYFIRSKYTLYIDILEEWNEIDKIYYGDNGHLENFFCLNWTQEELEPFEEEYELFKKAVKDGEHVSLTKEEISQWIERIERDVER